MSDLGIFKLGRKDGRMSVDAPSVEATKSAKIIKDMPKKQDILERQGEIINVK
ncbi:hypothetical protein GZ989_011600 (plasmid) [Campylobacter fetus]|uniref:Uncharacterized protein n=1 Tax=Campylobacter fetus TaxID=196 RepID=A0A974RKT6_CAMFE|nr:hypothetical protein [Campylobacter fetus]QMS59922.1 hypothetical protein GZ989_011600 [Campylobacter fetus]